MLVHICTELLIMLNSKEAAILILKWILVVLLLRLSGQNQACLFFFYENILSVKKGLKLKTNHFYHIRSFCFLIFVLLVGFGLICVLVRSKSILKEK